MSGCRNLERVASLQDRVMRGLSWGQEARRTLTSEMECRHAANRGLHREIRQVGQQHLLWMLIGSIERQEKLMAYKISHDIFFDFFNFFTINQMDTN